MTKKKKVSKGLGDKELLEDVSVIKQAIEAELTEKSSIPYPVWEREKRRDNERDKAKFSIIRMLILCLFFTNAIWIYVFQSYDYTSTTTTYTTSSEGESANAVINRKGTVSINGEINSNGVGNDSDKDKN